MKYLLINAHPRDKSYNQALTQFLIDGLTQAGHAVQYINTATLQLPYYNSGTKRTQNSEYQDMISGCDHIVFIFPVWNMDCPASMKNFFDSQFCKGFSYKVENGKQVGLLKGKKGSVIATCGGKLHFLFKLLLWITWGKGRIGFAGMQRNGSKVLCNAVQRPQQDRVNFMNDCLKRLSR